MKPEYLVSFYIFQTTVLQFQLETPSNICFLLKFYLECMAGYVGPNCTIRCPFPSYGDNCQGNCYCSEENCDVSTGCRTVTTETCN